MKVKTSGKKTAKYQLLGILSVMFFLPSTVTFAYAQYYGGGSESITNEQRDFCIKYEIDPCTEENILAKERVLTIQNTQSGTSPEGSATPPLTNIPSSTIGGPTITDSGIDTQTQIPVDWSIIGIVIVAVVAVVAVAVVAIRIKRPATAEKV